MHVSTFITPCSRELPEKLTVFKLVNNPTSLKAEVSYIPHKIPTLDIILGQINPVHNIISPQDAS
jgi:hypothetical protein